MSGRMLALLVLLVAPTLGGCVGMTSETEVFGRGHKQTLQLDVPEHERLLARPAADPAAPLVFHNGTPEAATAVLIQEPFSRSPYRPPTDRPVCGGAVIAIPQGAPDPLKLLPPAFGPRHGPEPTYEASRMVTDTRGREWTTDLYHAHQETTNRTWEMWVVNVGGGLAYAPDDGQRACRPIMTGSTPFNALVHAWAFEGELDLYYSPTARFPAPESRAWVLGPVD